MFDNLAAAVVCFAVWAAGVGAEVGPAGADARGGAGRGAGAVPLTFSLPSSFLFHEHPICLVGSWCVCRRLRSSLNAQQCGPLLCSEGRPCQLLMPRLVRRHGTQCQSKQIRYPLDPPTIDSCRCGSWQQGGDTPLPSPAAAASTPGAAAALGSWAPAATATRASL